MKSLSFFLFSYFFIIIAACTSKKTEVATETQQQKIGPIQSSPLVQSSISREFREALFFAASLEREALKLLTQQNSFDSTTLFSALSYAFEINSGVKKMMPLGLDCSRYQIDDKKNEFQVMKTCTKPSVLWATIQKKSENQTSENYQVIFKIKEWASVVGLSVTLTNSDIKCDFQLKNKKFQSLDCENWTFAISDQFNSTNEIKLSKFTFHRDLDPQFTLKGGFYRDLIERKKIEVVVPIQGKIKLIEKEVLVVDDFADQPNKPIQKEVTHGEKTNIQSESESKTPSESKTQNENQTHAKDESQAQKSDESQSSNQETEKSFETNNNENNPEEKDTHSSEESQNNQKNDSSVRRRGR